MNIKPLTTDTVLAPDRRARLLNFWERYGVWLAVLLAVGLVFFVVVDTCDFVKGFRDGWNSYPSRNLSSLSSISDSIGLFIVGTIIVTLILGVFFLVGCAYYQLIHKPLLGRGKLPYTILFVCCFMLFIELVSTGLEKVLLSAEIKRPLKTVTAQERAASSAAILTAGTVIFCLLTGVYLDRRRNQQQQKTLTQQRTQAQLDALKAQVNPHFLFNSLNNIFGTAMQEAAPRTAESVEQLATIMRYVLDESRNQTTPVERELRFIDDYINLHKLRLPTLDHIQITTDLYWDEQPAGVVPLLLNPLIENAFKYGISIQYPCFVQISLRVEARTLTLHVRNSVLPRADLERGTGIGLANVRQRLELAYPGRHTLTLEPGNTEFGVRLRLQL
jgi:two-component sensor histidine kinase